jgi:hypothetical protein
MTQGHPAAVRMTSEARHTTPNYEQILGYRGS